jgi:hypothetical protein
MVDPPRPPDPSRWNGTWVLLWGQSAVDVRLPVRCQQKLFFSQQISVIEVFHGLYGTGRTSR